MNLIQSLRLELSSPAPTICFVGAGGKTTALFQLARQFKGKLVLTTATTHLGDWQTSLADRHIIAKDPQQIQLPEKGVVLITGEVKENRTQPATSEILSWLRAKSKELTAPLLIEADGSRQKPLKAPAAHEPPIPEFADLVISVVGMSVLHQLLNEEHAHRSEIFSSLAGLAQDNPITPHEITRYLIHPQGGLKNIPPHARRIVLLNQADTPKIQAAAGGMAKDLLTEYDSVLIGSLQKEQIYRAERTAGIILAAGASSRYGKIKQLLDWKGKPFIRHIAETALHAGLEPVVIVTGYHHTDIESHLQDLPVIFAHNEAYEQGQSTSIKAGLAALPRNTGAAIFLLADQPQIPEEVIRALVESHASEGQAILAPLVLEERRANPVLFDRSTFSNLMKLQGDMGGRGIFDKHRVSYLPWHDDILLFDVDKPEDYERLKNFQ